MCCNNEGHCRNEICICPALLFQRCDLKLLLSVLAELFVEIRVFRRSERSGSVSEVETRPCAWNFPEILSQSARLAADHDVCSQGLRRRKLGYSRSMHSLNLQMISGSPLSHSWLICHCCDCPRQSENNRECRNTVIGCFHCLFFPCLAARLGHRSIVYYACPGETPQECFSAITLASKAMRIRITTVEARSKRRSRQPSC